MSPKTSCKIICTLFVFFSFSLPTSPTTSNNKLFGVSRGSIALKCNNKQVENNKLVVLNHQNDGTALCDACTKNIQTVKDFAKQNPKLIESAKQSLHLLCINMPSEAEVKECVKKLDRIVDKAIGEILNKSATAICQKISMCPTKACY